MGLPSTVLIVGASGFVGRNLISALAGAVERIIAVSRSGTPVEGAQRAASLAAIGGLPALPHDTVVVHLAADRYDAARHEAAQSDLLVGNTAITNAVYTFCVERGIREVRLASSVAVYPAGLAVMDDRAPVDLNLPPHPGEAMYAWSKRWAEIAADLYAAKYGINTVSLRLSNPYGPHDSLDPKRAHVLPAFVMRALGPEPSFVLTGSPAVERDFIYVGDVVSAFRRSLEWRGRNERLNLCRGETTTLGDLARTILRLAGTGKTLEFAEPGGASGVAVRRSANEKLKELLGPVSFASLDEGLEPTIDWYRDALR